MSIDSTDISKLLLTYEHLTLEDILQHIIKIEHILNNQKRLSKEIEKLRLEIESLRPDAGK